MAATEECPHCGFAVPARSLRCPGCSRRHATVKRSPRVPRLSAGGRGPTYRSLLAPAQATRVLLGVAGAISLALCGSLVARLALSFDEVRARLNGATHARVTDLTDDLTLATLAAAAVTGLAFGWWALRAYRNLAGLGTSDRRYLGVVVHRWWVLSAAVPAALYLASSWAGGPIAGLEENEVAALLALIAAALLVCAARAAHAIVGIVTVAHAHRAEVVAAYVVRERSLSAPVIAGV